MSGGQDRLFVGLQRLLVAILHGEWAIFHEVWTLNGVSVIEVWGWLQGPYHFIWRGWGTISIQEMNHWWLKWGFGILIILMELFWGWTLWHWEAWDRGSVPVLKFLVDMTVTLFQESFSFTAPLEHPFHWPIKTRHKVTRHGWASEVIKGVKDLHIWVIFGSIFRLDAWLLYRFLTY